MCTAQHAAWLHVQLDVSTPAKVHCESVAVIKRVEPAAASADGSVCVANTRLCCCLLVVVVVVVVFSVTATLDPPAAAAAARQLLTVHGVLLDSRGFSLSVSWPNRRLVTQARLMCYFCCRRAVFSVPGARGMMRACDLC